MIKFISIHGEKEREIKRTVFGSVGRSKTIERGKTREGGRGGGRTMGRRGRIKSGELR